MSIYPEHASVAAHRVLKEFSENTPSLAAEELHERGERVAQMLRLFVGDRLPEPAYDAAALLPLARSIQHSDTADSAASWALLEYLTNPLEERRVDVQAAEYLLDVWGDFAVIDQAVFDYEARIAALDTAFGRQALALLAIEDDTPIPAERWLDVRAGVNVPKIREVSHEVNVESIIIGAASLLDEIMHEKDARKQLHDVLVAETFYCPALDALGLTAMEMAMRSEVNRVRLENVGRTDLVEYAEAVLEPVHKIGQDRVLETLFDTSLSDDNTAFHLRNETPYGEAIYFRDSELESAEDELWSGARILARTKTVKSLALKMLENPDYKDTLPSDIIGMTAILRGEVRLAAFFNHVVELVESLDNVQFVTAASKRQPMYVQGSREFVESLRAKFDESFLDRVEFKEKDPSESTFQVAKMTFTVEIDGVVIPVEFQFQTEADRERSRLGDASHIYQKSRYIREDMPSNKPGNPNDLRDINHRRHIWLALDKKVIVVGNHGAQFAEQIDQAARDN